MIVTCPHVTNHQSQHKVHNKAFHYKVFILLDPHLNNSHFEKKSQNQTSFCKTNVISDPFVICIQSNSRKTFSQEHDLAFIIHDPNQTLTILMESS